MDNNQISRLAVGDETDRGHPEIGSEWFGVRLAERSLRRDMPDIELFDLYMYCRDKRFDDDRYQALALCAEDYLRSRFGGKYSLNDGPVDDTEGFEPEQYREAVEVVFSADVTNNQLLSISELAMGNRHAEGEPGQWWEILYDLTRIQILRRIHRARLLPANVGEHSVANTARRQTNKANAGAEETPNYDWLDRPAHDDDWQASEVRRELQLAEATYSDDMPDELLFRLYFFILDRFDDNKVWKAILEKAEGLMLARMSGEPETPILEYARGFDQEDHALLLEALREDALPNKDLLHLYLVARVNSGSPHMDDPDRHLTEEWKPIYSLIREQILARLAAGREQRERADERGATGGAAPNFDWLDDVYSDDDSAEDDEVGFGWEREELRLAEEAFSPDMPDELLLRYYRFVMDHGEEDGSVWDVIRDKTNRLMLSRIRGGPDERAEKYKHGFDPKDHALAVEAISLDAVPYSNLLSLYRVAWRNRQPFPEWNDDKQFVPNWGPVFDLIRDKLLAIMAATRLEKQAASNAGCEGTPANNPKGAQS